MLLRVLPAKKSTPEADTVLKFVGEYIKFITDKAAEDRQDELEDDADTDTTALRFTERLIKLLLKGFQAEKKLCEMVAHLGEVDEDIYSDLQNALLDRINDKEVMIRVQVVTALSKLAISEDLSEINEGESTVLQMLIDILSTDPSA
ncbi:hypothetical protein B0H17DRAFT_1139263 [Mycena rosella]|uniref:Uncharacterized protein n=1 Tax=Mycena rosella TaxID=1033263 RepID=A0AAD7D4L9_MYCRO|nr:hypothetical protein B0H17DRAFT_1139263 [Mycena rosella]